MLPDYDSGQVIAPVSSPHFESGYAELREKFLAKYPGFHSFATDARYLLAYADSRVNEKARTMPEYPWPDSVVVRVTPAGRVPVTPSSVSGRSALLYDSAMPALPATAKTEVAAMLPTGCPYLNSWAPYCRATPYVLGDVFTHYPAGRPNG